MTELVAGTTVVRHYCTLCKPRLTRLVTLTALCGAAVAPGHLSLSQWLSFTLATLGIVGAANAINCYLERDVDALMERTKTRPLVTGEISPGVALALSLVLATASVLVLALTLNVLTAVLGFIAFLLYVAVYTPLKRQSLAALFVGAVPGAIPPAMGWTALTGSLDIGAWILFGILFFWQLPHFIAISLRWQGDYDRAGLKTLSGSVGPSSAHWHMLIYAALMVAVSLLPYTFGLAGALYVLATAIAGFAFAAVCAAGLLGRADMKWSRLVFLGSLLYLPVVLGVWVLDQWLAR